MKLNRSFFAAFGVAVIALSVCSCKKNIEMVKVKGGTFSPAQINQMNEIIIAQKDIMDENSPDFSLSVSDFYISKFEITQELYKSIMNVYLDCNPEPSYFCQDITDCEKQEMRPVERVTWFDALFFCNKLSEKEGLEQVYKIEGIKRFSKDGAIKEAEVTADFSKNGYRLPTNAEWTWAAAGGKKEKRIYKYSGSDSIDSVAWHIYNSNEMTHEAGLKKQNALGLYDMTGNVAEWCWDYIWNEQFENKSYLDYKGPEEGKYRYIKGGCFVENSSGASFPCGVYEKLGGAENKRNYNIGFRVVRNAD